MSLTHSIRNSIIDTLLYEIGRDEYKHDFSVSNFAKTHQVTTQSVYRYLRSLESENKIVKIKKGNRNTYELVENLTYLSFPIEKLVEDIVWSRSVKPLLNNVPETALRICNYAFCEMLNNAIDHSEGTEVGITVGVNAVRVAFDIVDNGVGIFTKIASAMNLEEKRFAVLELAKGKLTTAPERHTGEGIFFSAKASDYFSIISDNFIFEVPGLYGSEIEKMSQFKGHPFGGTAVFIHVLFNHRMPLSEVFDQYTSDPDGYGFTKTTFHVLLLEHGDPNPTFVSRSQAKRLLARLEKFERIELDFSGIEEIGQGFADEVFRVFGLQHPNSKIVAAKCSKSVAKMIKHIIGDDSLFV